MPIMLQFATRAAFGHKEGSMSNYLRGVTLRMKLIGGSR